MMKNALEKIGINSIIMSSIPIERICRSYNLSYALHYLSKEGVVIFAGGTGNTYFTTDMAAVLRALEIKSNILLKGTKVDGIYSNDPTTSYNANHFKNISYIDILY